MEFSPPLFRKVITAVLFSVLAVVNLSCDFPSYDSPLAGVLSIRLKTISTEIPFAATNDLNAANNFNLTINEVKANVSNGSYVALYEDVKAFGRTDPTIVNALDKRARDSSLIIGEGFAPPATYSGVSIILDPALLVTLQGYRNIQVNHTSVFYDNLVFNGHFSLSSNDTTHIIVTVLLDSLLQKQAETYNYVLENPYTHHKFFYISSIY
ncbi:MAG TPA: hypothetical protein VKS81_10375 [Bacteroidota bacterium]|nr:hypothetical protein [Bacteroidota bacterium]